MLIVQQNCGKEYECTISALEAGIGLGAIVICIQEPFWAIEVFNIQDLICIGRL